MKSVNTSVWPEAEPLDIKGTDTGVLLIHGFTGCNHSILPWAKGISDKCAYTIKAPRLSGHGTTIEDMASRSWREWAGDAERAFEELREETDAVFVGGLSMGAALAMYLAQRYSHEISGIMLLNGPVYLRSPAASMAGLLKHIVFAVPAVGSDIKDRRSIELCYSKTPVPSVEQLNSFLREIRSNLKMIGCPALIMQSRNDHVVKPSNAAYINNKIGSRDKRLIWLENSYHVATLDFDLKRIVDLSCGFMNSASRKSA